MPRWPLLKRRRLGNHDATETLNIIGDVTGKRAITVDDEIDTGRLAGQCCRCPYKQGAKEVYSCCTHPVFSGPAIDRISKSAVKEVVVADTIPVNGSKKIDKITVLPIAPLLGEAIHRIHTGMSIGAMFED